MVLFGGQGFGPSIPGQFEMDQSIMSPEDARLAELSGTLATLVWALACVGADVTFQDLVTL